MPIAEIDEAKIHRQRTARASRLSSQAVFRMNCPPGPRWSPLLKDDFFVVTLDSRGSGRTKCNSAPFIIETLASVVIELRKSLEFERFRVLGASMGGVIAQQVSIGAPDAVPGLVLVSTYSMRPPRSSFDFDAMIKMV